MTESLLVKGERELKKKEVELVNQSEFLEIQRT